MDEEMKNFCEEFLEPMDIDWDYEFDAPHFFDFDQTESVFEEQEVGLWFQIAGSYPPSPLVAKLKKEKSGLENKDAISRPKKGEKVKSINKNVNSPACDDDVKDSDIEDERKSVPKTSRISTRMKPTASQLAKLSKAKDTDSSCLNGRVQNAPLHNNGKCFQSSPASDNGESKRQKLEIGYLRKIAQLKHQNALLHKFSKKVTIAKEPELETNQRAHHRRSRTSSNSSEYAEPKSHASKARPLNTKILHVPSSLPPKKTRSKLPDFQACHLKTMERTKQNSSTNDLIRDDDGSSVQSGVAESKRPNSLSTLKEKRQTSQKAKLRSLNAKIFPTKDDIDRTDNIIHEVAISKETKSIKDEKVSSLPPTDLFQKLSLRSESEKDKASHRKSTVLTKVSKENNPHQLQPELLKYVVKPKQCGSRYLIPGLVCQSNLSRSLGIR